jgi:beta-lactamase class A
MSSNDDFIRNILKNDPAQRFERILQNDDSYRVQIALSVVRHDAQGGLDKLERHSYRAGAEYFYPASTVKVCAAVAALQTLRERSRTLQLPLGITSRLVMHPSPSDSPQEAERVDHSNLTDQTITVLHEIRKLFLVSDNPAFNRLFNLVGQRELNQRMWSAGLTSVRIRHRLYDRVFANPPDERCFSFRF